MNRSWNRKPKKLVTTKNAKVLARNERGEEMAHLILGLPEDVEIEFLNGNSLDCRRENLRALVG